MKFPKVKWLQIRLAPDAHEKVTAFAEENGFTITGMVRVALRKVFKLKI